MFKGTAYGAWLTEPRFLYPRVWDEMTEERGIGSCDAHDTYQRECATAIFKKGSALVIGEGGTGKSKLIEYLLELYKEADVRVDVVAFTHVQAQNCTGGTVLSDLHKNPRRKRRTVIVDEGGQVPLSLWGALNAYRSANGCNLIVMGDFAGQLPPITDHDNFDLWKQFPHSAFMHDLCGGFRVRLNKFRRRKWLHGEICTSMVTLHILS